MRDTAYILSARAGCTARWSGPTVCAGVADRQRGGVAVMLAVLLPVIIGFVGLSLELAQIYNRKVEMQAVADAIAISAAKKLNGTSEGLTSAVAAAREIAENGFLWTKLTHGYGNPIVFSEDAIRFGKSSDGSSEWLGFDAAKASPEGLAYVQVNTYALGLEYGKVNLMLMRVLKPEQSVQVGHVSVAGRRHLNATPLAICAMSKNPSAPIQARENSVGYSELTEYGFRRGVSYNLLKLNPASETPVNYLVDPISLPPKSYPSNFKIETVGQYVCTGTVELPRIIGDVNLQNDFPIEKLLNHLNSRFDLSKGACNPKSAPPDSNIRQYPYGTNNWMAKPKGQVAQIATSAGRAESIADLPPPNDQAPDLYGPLWAYARAVPWATYLQQKPEPARGFTPFPATAAAWKGLYSTGPGMNTYPSGSTGLLSPYFTQTTSPTVSPMGIQYRRVLHVPLLACPVSGSRGQVVAIGRFFMTIAADANGIYAEFAGVAPREEIAGPVELYQ